MFSSQISWSIIVGFMLIYLFGWYFAPRDSDDWQKCNWPLWKHVARYVGLTINFAATIVFFVLIIVNYEDYEYTTILSLTMFTFVSLSLGLYALRFRPSPRSFWIKLRKCVGYYLIFSVYSMIGSRTIPILGMVEAGTISSAYLLGNILSHIIFLVIIFFLLRRCKKEKFFPYEEYEPCTIKRYDIIGNTKRSLAFYIGYEIIIFIIFSIIAIVKIDNRDSIAIPIALFALLSLIPIGLYWMLRLLRESKE